MTNLEVYKDELIKLFENADGLIPPIATMFRFIRQNDEDYRSKYQLTIKEAFEWLAKEHKGY